MYIMFLFIIYSVILLILLHFILYYFNIDYLNIIKNQSDGNSKVIKIEDGKKEKILNDLETSQKSLEDSLNELKQMSTL